VRHWSRITAPKRSICFKELKIKPRHQCLTSNMPCVVISHHMRVRDSREQQHEAKNIFKPISRAPCLYQAANDSLLSNPHVKEFPNRKRPVRLATPPSRPGTRRGVAQTRQPEKRMTPYPTYRQPCPVMSCLYFAFSWWSVFTRQTESAC
jgi:hypothetical protein